MRLRLWTVLAFVIMWAALPVSGAAYRDSDNGLLGTLEREAHGRVGFSRLANCLSMVMEASGISSNELRRLREGRRVVVDERIFDPSFRPSTATIAESKRILALDSGAVDARIVQELRAELEEEREANKRKLDDLQSQLDAQRENARVAAENFKSLQADLETKLSAALKRADRAETEVSAYKKSIFRELARKAFGRPAAAMAIWFVLGMLAALIFHWIWRELYLKPKNFIRPLEVRMKAEDGTRHLFTWNEEEGDYDCEECQKNSRTSNDPDIAREQGRGLKLENLKAHLDRKHPKFRIFTPKRDTTAA